MTKSKGNRDSHIRSIVKSMLDKELELHQVVVTSSGTTANAGAVVTITQPIVQGDDITQRTASQITLKELEFTFIAVVNDLSTVKGQFVRFILFGDRENIGTVPAVTDVLNTSAVISPYNTAAYQEHRFLIYSDKTLCLSTAGDSSVYSKVVSKKLSTKVTYRGTTNITASNGKNSIWLIVLTDQTATQPAYSMNCNLRFHDA